MVGDKVQVIYEPGLAYSREKNPAVWLKQLPPLHVQMSFLLFG
jgi:hypothetical protein